MSPPLDRIPQRCATIVTKGATRYEDRQLGWLFGGALCLWGPGREREVSEKMGQGPEEEL